MLSMSRWASRPGRWSCWKTYSCAWLLKGLLAVLLLLLLLSGAQRLICGAACRCTGGAPGAGAAAGGVCMV